MSWKQVKNIAKRFLTPGRMSRKQLKKIRSHLGLTSKNRWVRSIRRSAFGKGHAGLSAGYPTSAANFQSRSLSQLTGGV